MSSWHSENSGLRDWLDLVMTQKHKQTKGLVHHLPHRTRFRVSHRHRDEGAVRRIRDSVMSVAGVKSVEVNERTGSVLVHHEERAAVVDNVSEALTGIGWITKGRSVSALPLFSWPLLLCPFCLALISRSSASLAQRPARSRGPGRRAVAVSGRVLSERCGSRR